jgi:DNA-binding MarR family transcriptional regulator
MDLRQVFDDLVRFETELWNGIDTRLRSDCSVPLGSFNVLLVIADTPSCRVNDIAGALSITIGGASQAVDRLEQVGHVARRANPADRRSSIVELTAAGQRVLEQAGPAFDDELEARLVAPLSKSALAQLGVILSALRANAPRSS